MSRGRQHGFLVSESTKKQISMSLSGRSPSEETKAKMRVAQQKRFARMKEMELGTSQERPQAGLHDGRSNAGKDRSNKPGSCAVCGNTRGQESCLGAIKGCRLQSFGLHTSEDEQREKRAAFERRAQAEVERLQAERLKEQRRAAVTDGWWIFAAFDADDVCLTVAAKPKKGELKTKTSKGGYVLRLIDIPIEDRREAMGNAAFIRRAYKGVVYIATARKKADTIKRIRPVFVDRNPSWFANRPFEFS